jgi:hypothetical protein
MVDLGLSHVLEDYPQTQAQKKYPYLEAHASNTLSSALSAKIKDEIEIEYGWPERANFLWKVLEQMYGSSNRQRSSSSVPENISSSCINIDQGQEEQSHTQEEKVESTSLEKLDCSISQTGVSGFGRTKITLAEEEDCSTSSSHINDDDVTDDKYDHEELLLEFQKTHKQAYKIAKET